jgi:cysteinyl-tRNA synthetase
VYNEVHIGNLRTFITFDIVYRYLRHLGYQVRYVRNITDVGHIVTEFDEGVDRIGKQAKLEAKEPMEIVQQYTNSFHEVMRMFNCIEPGIEPTATGHIVEQIEMVKRILSNGFAYEVNGSVYFDVRKFSEQHSYGKLSGRNLEELMENTRDTEGQDEKRFFADFALWKRASKEHIMRWPSPWGDGFPGWHLECSVMSTKYLGQQFDIHGGGMDLKFPHHECEIAQSIGADGTEPVRYWMHGNMLTVNGAKMSRSLNNSFLPRDLVRGSHHLLQQAYSPMTVRFFLLQTHYASTLDFTNDGLLAAEKGYRRLMNAMNALEELRYDENAATTDSTLSNEILALCDACTERMNEDFNTPETLAALFELSAKINAMKHGQLQPEAIQPAHFQKLRSTFKTVVTDILGLENESAPADNAVTARLIEIFIKLRREAREKKDFAASDQLRNALLAAGVQLKDDKDGTTSWEIINS